MHGWVKIHTYTENPESIFAYQPWWIERGQGLSAVDVDDWRKQGERLIAHVNGIDDRDIARTICQRDIHVDKQLLPALPGGEFYWHQLIGLTAIARYNGSEQELGQVVSLLETGANDVLVVREIAGEADRRERLIPYPAVTEVDLRHGILLVDWDPEF